MWELKSSAPTTNFSGPQFVTVSSAYCSSGCGHLTFTAAETLCLNSRNRMSSPILIFAQKYPWFDQSQTFRILDSGKTCLWIPSPLVGGITKRDCSSVRVSMLLAMLSYGIVLVSILALLVNKERCVLTHNCLNTWAAVVTSPLFLLPCTLMPICYHLICLFFPPISLENSALRKIGCIWKHSKSEDSDTNFEEEGYVLRHFRLQDKASNTGMWKISILDSNT